MNDRLGITVGSELMTFVDQFLTNLLVVVNLTVEENLDRAIFVGNRLATSSQIDDGKSPETKRNTYRWILRFKCIVKIKSFVVRPSVLNNGRHPGEQFRRYSFLRVGPNRSGNAAHKRSSTGKKKS